jgi:hypothetical protein
MVSLNQLDQLISINQTLSSMTTASSTASGSGSGSGAQGQTAGANPLGALAGGNTAAAAAALGQQQPAWAATPNTSGLMNLYGSVSPSAPATNSTLSGGR